MSKNRPARRSTLLLAGFVLLSALIHAAVLLVAPSMPARTVALLAPSPPLQVMVVSSRGSLDDARPTGETALKEHPALKKRPRPSATEPVTNRAPAAITPTADSRPAVTAPPDRHAVEKTTASAQPATGQAVTKEHSAHSTQAQPAPVNHLRAQLRSELARHFTYPRLARRKGWEGQVGLTLHIDEDGSLERIRIVRSSGYKVLDENARSTLDRIGRISVAANMIIIPVDTEIEVLYRLTD